ncbi:MAG: hypothetical protein V8R91_12265 [Butyricimonas faecihominis]
MKVEAEEEGIRAAVQFLKEDFFDLYSDEVKKDLFPSKIPYGWYAIPKRQLCPAMGYDQSWRVGFSKEDIW